jgi:hypothetical protein
VTAPLVFYPDNTDPEASFVLVRDFLLRHPEDDFGPEELASLLGVTPAAAEAALEVLRDDEGRLLP